MRQRLGIAGRWMPGKPGTVSEGGSRAPGRADRGTGRLSCFFWVFLVALTGSCVGMAGEFHPAGRLVAAVVVPAVLLVLHWVFVDRHTRTLIRKFGSLRCFTCDKEAWTHLSLHEEPDGTVIHQCGCKSRYTVSDSRIRLLNPEGGGQPVTWAWKGGRWEKESGARE